MIFRHRVASVAIAVVLAVAATSSVDVAQAQLFGGGNAAELQMQIERLQRDVIDLQMEVFRRDDQSGAALSAQRVDDIEQSLRRITGDMEELMFRLDQVSQRMDQMQNQIDFVERNQNAQRSLAGLPPDGGLGEPGGEQALELSAGQSGELVLAPSAGTLGTIPDSIEMPTSAVPLQENVLGLDNAPPGGLSPLGPPGDPQAEYDTAMDLLTRAQYGLAEEAFRSLSLTYPDTELGGQALYWTADIAYSVDRDYQGAARDFAELLRQYPDAPRAPEGMLKLGLSLLALGQTEEGCVTLAALPRTFPNATASITTRARNERGNAACA